MSSVLPLPTPSWSGARVAVSMAAGSAAAPGKSSDGGIGAQQDSTASSAWAAPSAEKPNTRSPTATSATPSPSSSTTPAASWPMVCGSSPSIRPLRFFQSLGLTPAARTAIRTWPGPGCGSGRSTISRTSGPPNWLKRTAFIIRSDLDPRGAAVRETFEETRITLDPSVLRHVLSIHQRSQGTADTRIGFASRLACGRRARERRAAQAFRACLWADPAALPPDTAEYTAAVITAAEHGLTFTLDGC